MYPTLQWLPLLTGPLATAIVALVETEGYSFDLILQVSNMRPANRSTCRRPPRRSTTTTRPMTRSCPPSPLAACKLAARFSRTTSHPIRPRKKACVFPTCPKIVNHFKPLIYQECVREAANQNPRFESSTDSYKNIQKIMDIEHACVSAALNASFVACRCATHTTSSRGTLT